MKLGQQGRTVHTAATRELDAHDGGRKIVRAMHARNRQRFRNDRQALEQWISARTEMGAQRPAPADALARIGTAGAGRRRRAVECRW